MFLLSWDSVGDPEMLQRLFSEIFLKKSPANIFLTSENTKKQVICI